MGIRKEYIEFLSKNADFEGKKILELGNQIIKDGCLGHYKSSKEYFGSIGCFHLSIDKNGENGAMSYDLSKKITKFDGVFDVVTDFGTSIYVDNKKACYDNIYRMVKPGGVVVHILPAVGSAWVAKYFVDRKFFNDVAKKYNCKIKSLRFIDGLHGKLVAVALEKNEIPE